jgi:serine phosphatase RsbU (regulator of sigma subunit)
VYVRIMNKLKTKVDRVRLLIKERNSNKVKEYLKEREEEEWRELSIRVLRHLSQLIFRHIF